MRSLFALVGLQAAWWTCALSAGKGLWWPGALASLALTTFQIASSSIRRATISICIAAAIAGALGESILVATRTVTYAAASPAIGLAPLWLVMLWIAFAASIGPLARWLGPGASLSAALLGAASAAPTYWLGQSFGALAITDPQWRGLAAITLLWAVATPLLVAVWHSSGGNTDPQTGSPAP